MHRPAVVRIQVVRIVYASSKTQRAVCWSLSRAQGHIVHFWTYHLKYIRIYICHVVRNVMSMRILLCIIIIGIKCHIEVIVTLNNLLSCVHWYGSGAMSVIARLKHELIVICHECHRWLMLQPGSDTHDITIEWCINPTVILIRSLPNND